jgi:hypothetical protein
VGVAEADVLAWLVLLLGAAAFFLLLWQPDRVTARTVTSAIPPTVRAWARRGNGPIM